jgi:hypothetical protein
MRKQENIDGTGCPVEIAALPFEQWNQPRRGDLLCGAQSISQSANDVTQTAQSASQSGEPEAPKTA